MTICQLRQGQQLDIFLDFPPSGGEISILLDYTYNFGSLSRRNTLSKNLIGSGRHTLLSAPPANSTISKEVHNIVYRKLSGSPIVTVEFVEAAEKFILQTFDTFDLPNIFDFQGIFSDFGG